MYTALKTRYASKGVKVVNLTGGVRSDNVDAVSKATSGKGKTLFYFEIKEGKSYSNPEYPEDTDGFIYDGTLWTMIVDSKNIEKSYETIDSMMSPVQAFHVPEKAKCWKCGKGCLCSAPGASGERGPKHYYSIKKSAMQELGWKRGDELTQDGQRYRVVSADEARRLGYSV